jgi:hypothetical protein
VAGEARIEIPQRNSPGVSLMRANYQQLRGEMIDAGDVTAEEVDRDLSRLDDPNFLMPSSIMGNRPLGDEFATRRSRYGIPVTGARSCARAVSP